MSEVEKKVVPPNEYLEALAVLRMLDDLLHRGDQQAQHLWNLLSALRGPDDRSRSSLKYEFTTKIRALAFPKTQQQYQKGVACVPADFADSDTQAKSLQEPLPHHHQLGYDHFVSHLRTAVLALKAFGRLPE